MNPTEPRGSERSRRAGPLAVLCLSAFGLGLSPIMPGTVGSLGTAALLFFAPTGLVAYVGLSIACLVFGTWATLAFAGRLAVEDAEGKHGDPGWVVSDEVAGQALASLGTLPWFGDWRHALIAFVAFRVFDMTKVSLVGKAERLPGALGVLMDDVVAGALAAAVTLLLGASGWLA